MIAMLRRASFRELPETGVGRALLLMVLVAGCRSGQAAEGAAADADDGQWPMGAKDYQNRRYTGLAEVTTANVSNLKVAWTFSTGIGKGHEAAPLVAGGTMYV